MLLLSACGGGGGEGEATTNDKAATINTAPEITITAPNSGASFAEQSDITLQASAGDANDGDLSANINWSSNIDGNLGTGASISVQLTAGSHVITAQITDSGDLTDEATVNLTISDAPAENTAPTLNITAPGNNTNFNQGVSVDFSANASDAQDSNLNPSIQWASNRDGNLGSGADISATLSAGTHNITASVSDSGGLTDSANISVTISVAPPPNTAPSVAVTSPAADSNFEAGSSITFAASANDSEDGNLSGQIQWSSSRDGNIGNGASFSAQLSEGTHTITASVSDSGGLTDSASLNITVNAADQNTAPSVAISSPSNNTQVTEGTSLSFNGSASDAEDGDLSTNIQWASNLDGALGSGAATSATLSVGTHTIVASVSDSENISSSASITITVVAAENSAPTISITSPSNNSVSDFGSNVTFTGTASDEEDGNLDSNIQWSSDLDGDLGNGASLAATLSAGEHTITATISDSGNDSTSANISIRINSLPTVDAGDDQTVNEDISVALTASASDSDGTIATYQWSQTSGDSVTLNDESTQSASFTAPTLPDGTNSQLFEFEVTVTDNDGAVTTDTLAITVIKPGDQTDCTLTINPGDSFNSAFGQMSAGDTLCLNDGQYQQAMDIPSNMNVRAVNDGMAEIDGMGSLGEDWSGGLVQMKGDNSSVRGLRVHHASTNADACHLAGTNHTMKFMSCAHGGSHKHKIPLKMGGSGHLIEDSWAFGEGRYVVQCFIGDHITIRRTVARWDSTAPNNPTEPNAAFSIYNCSDVTVENNISLDYGTPETEMQFGGDFYSPHNNGIYPELNHDNHFLGNIVINHSQDTLNNRAFRADTTTNTTIPGVIVKDFYMRDSKTDFAVHPSYDISITKCTRENVENESSTYNCNNDADISVRYQDGVKTSDALFPFNHEALIKRDMCASGERQSDWCSSTKTLTDYVLNQ